MPTFVNPALLWGLAILAVPVLIHLINLIRHRRVEWAAMEFLLQSYKKNSAWIFLKQLLLLLLRVAAVAAIVFIVARPLIQSALGAVLGSRPTHHVVLLDDSYSMSDRWADTTAFARGKEVVRKIGVAAANERTAQKFTVLRFSRARRQHAADLLEELVASDFGPRLEAVLDRLQPSQLAVGPGDAIEAVAELLPPPEQENRVVCLVSDFRANQWNDPAALAQSLAELSRSGTRLQFVNCVDTARPNLGISSIKPTSRSRAAGVPLMMEVAVRNFGTQPAKNVAVLLREDGNSRPGAVIDQIPAGQSETARFQVFFPTAGDHQITARLESDAVETDNARHVVLDFPVSMPVLIVDPDPAGAGSRFLATALAPGGTVKTGLAPQIETPSYLANQPIDKFQAIYLVNVGDLEPKAVAALESYVRAGGGLGVFLGERSRAEFINERLYRAGDGFFPLPVAAPAELLVDRLEKAPDLQITDHPVFKIFTGERNSFIQAVLVTRYFTVPIDWSPPRDSPTRVIARLRNDAPLAVETQFGTGRVIALLTTAGPEWNNWCVDNPAYPVAMLELFSYLAGVPEETRVVGSPLALSFDPAKYQPQVSFLVPADEPHGPVRATAKLTDSTYEVSLPDTDYAGVYEVHLTTADGQTEVRRYALNVVPEEGDLAIVTGPELAERLAGIRFDYQHAADFQWSAADRAGFDASVAILYALIVLLVGEQVLAYFQSYHPNTKVEAR